MSRISATISGIELRLLNRIGAANAAATLGELRLVTGQRINRAADDPSGFIELQRLRGELGGVSQAFANATAAATVVSGAQLALDQIHTQLNNIRTAAVADQDQALTAEQRAANQATIDAAIVEINRLAGTTSGGRKLLDGSADFDLSAVDSSQIRILDVISLGSSAGQTISGTVTSAAQRAALTYTGSGANEVVSTATFVLEGDRGSAEIEVVAGEALTDVADRINAESHLTGVTASVSTNVLTVSSIEYGTDADVAVDVTTGTFTVAGGNGDGTANGMDAAATINGEALIGKGNTFALNRNGLQFTVTFEGGFAGAFGVNVGSGGLAFALSPDLSRLARLAVPGVQASRLGGLSGTLDQLATGGAYAGLADNASRAVRIVDEALGRLTIVEGRLDGFAGASLTSSTALLEDLETTLTDAIETIGGVNDDREELLIAKNRQLVTNGLIGLNLLHQQRLQIVKILESIAGLG